MSRLRIREPLLDRTRHPGFKGKQACSRAVVQFPRVALWGFRHCASQIGEGGGGTVAPWR